MAAHSSAWRRRWVVRADDRMRRGVFDTDREGGERHQGTIAGRLELRSTARSGIRKGAALLRATAIGPAVVAAGTFEGDSGAVRACRHASRRRYPISVAATFAGGGDRNPRRVVSVVRAATYQGVPKHARAGQHHENEAKHRKILSASAESYAADAGPCKLHSRHKRCGRGGFSLAAGWTLSCRSAGDRSFGVPLIPSRTASRGRRGSSESTFAGRSRVA